MTHTTDNPGPWEQALALAHYDHGSIFHFKVKEAAEKGWHDELRLVAFGYAQPQRPEEPPDWYLPLNALANGFGPEEALNDWLRRRAFQRAIRDLIHLEWPLGLIPCFADTLRVDVLGKRFIQRDDGLYLWTEMGHGYEFGPLHHAAEVGEALLVLDGGLPHETEPRSIPAPPLNVASHLRDLPPADDWWWNWEERCLRSSLLYLMSHGAWAADELRDQLRRVLRIGPDNEAIQMGTDSDGEALARFGIPCVGMLALQAKALRCEHSCEHCGTVYSPPITGFEDLGWTLRHWEDELHRE